MYLTICICIKLHISIQMSPNQIDIHMCHFLLLPFGICDCLLQQWGKLGSHHMPCIYLVIQFQYMCIAVSEFWTRPPWKITLSIEYCFLCTISFAFSFTDSSFSKLLSEHPFFPHCFQWGCFIYLNTDSFVTFCISSWDSPDLYMILKVAYQKVNSLCCIF